jgi:ABC-type Fe3+ transport system substrate-binding protein
VGAAGGPAVGPGSGDGGSAVGGGAAVGGAVAGSAAPAWQQQWEETLAAARAEGRVVVAVPTEVIDEYRTAFRALRDRFGFEVEARGIPTAEVSQVLMRECSVGRQTVDVVQGGMSETFDVYPRGCLAPVKPRLILPEVADPANWRGGALKFNDPEGAYFLQLGESLYGPVIYNTERLKAEDVNSSRALLRPEYKGKIASYDPRRAGAGRGLATYFLDTLGPDYVRQLYLGQDVVSTADHRQLAEWVARGVYLVGLGHVERGVEPLRREGLPIGITGLEDAPGYVTGGSTVVKLVKDPPHPHAATVILNWLASREGQKLMMEALGQPSRRVDVETPDSVVPWYRLPREGVGYQDGYDYHYYTVERRETERAVIEILGR